MQPPGDTPIGPWWRRWIRATAATIGVIAALAGIWFSALSAQQQARAQRQTRVAAQLSLVTQLDAVANQSEEEINRSSLVDKFVRAMCRPAPKLDLPLSGTE